MRSFTRSLVYLLIGGFAVSLSGAARAQTAPPAPDAPPAADVQKTLTDIGDLSLLRALLPVKLQATQIDKLLPPLQTIRGEGATRRKADEAALRGLSAEVAKAHAAAIAQSTPVPTETEAKIVKTFNESDKRFADAKKNAIERILPIMQVNLSSEQRATIKSYVEDKMLDGKKFSSKAKPDAVENAALEIYIERILLDERSIAVLTLLRGAASSAPATDSAPPASTPPAAPTAPPAAKP